MLPAAHGAESHAVTLFLSAHKEYIGFISVWIPGYACCLQRHRHDYTMSAASRLAQPYLAFWLNGLQERAPVSTLAFPTPTPDTSSSAKSSATHRRPIGDAGGAAGQGEVNGRYQDSTDDLKVYRMTCGEDTR